MSMDAFGEQFDIHGGGHDLLFPHHEAEIFQENAIRVVHRLYITGCIMDL